MSTDRLQSSLEEVGEAWPRGRSGPGVHAAFGATQSSFTVGGHLRLGLGVLICELGPQGPEQVASGDAWRTQVGCTQDGVCHGADTPSASPQHNRGAPARAGGGLALQGGDRQPPPPRNDSDHTLKENVLTTH